jgi:beta-phosphoglucomutase-like phosphatase (HAD superfamily)
VIAADDVERGKPHPDGFNTALGRLGFQLRVRPPITAEECLVIEDTSAGIEAAHAAGMPVVAVAQTTSAANLAKADIVTESIAAIDLDSLLRQLLLRGD